MARPPHFAPLEHDHADLRDTCHVRIFAVAALGTVLLAGCSTSSSVSPASTSRSSEPVTSANVSPASPSGPASLSSVASSASSPAASSPAQCRLSDLRVSLGYGGGAAGSRFYLVRLTNVSSLPCRTGGFVGLSLVSSPRGNPIGAAADRTSGGKLEELVLKPGDRATATVQEGTAQNYPKARCKPTPATGFRIYPPNETHSAFVRNATTACSAATVHLLTVRPLRAR
jgi:Domain of unknown function (DUF4232)